MPKERRNALHRYRDRRRVWLTWLDTDEHHAIWQNATHHGVDGCRVRDTDGFAVANEENALNNPLIAEALVTGHVAAQVLAIRRLVEDSPKERLSLRGLVKDLNRHILVLSRAKTMSASTACRTTTGRSGRTIYFQSQCPEGVTVSSCRRLPKALADIVRYNRFDKLAGVHPTRRSREDRLPLDLFSTIGKWLDESGADELAKWASTYLAHAGGPNERTRLGDVEVT